MKNQYPQEIARHYAAYRPPLHLSILDKLIDKEESFQTGLDIGCGTGQSAIALSNFCNKVIGVEPSQDMLQRALPHAKAEYVYYNEKTLPFPDQAFEVITFSGSLFYARSQALLEEVVRVGAEPATLLVYDFEVIFDGLGPKITRHFEASDYDHAIDFSGLNLGDLRKVSTLADQMSLSISPANLAHLLLSVQAVYHNFAAAYGVTDPYTPLVEELRFLSQDSSFDLPVNIFGSRYEWA